MSKSILKTFVICWTKK